MSLSLSLPSKSRSTLIYTFLYKILSLLSVRLFTTRIRWSKVMLRLYFKFVLVLNNTFLKQNYLFLFKNGVNFLAFFCKAGFKLIVWVLVSLYLSLSLPSKSPNPFIYTFLFKILSTLTVWLLKKRIRWNKVKLKIYFEFV